MSTGVRLRAEPYEVEKHSLRGASLLMVAFLASVGTLSAIMALRLLVDGDGTPLTLVIYGLYPAIVVPVVAWEVLRCLPVRVELGPDEACMFVAGRLSRRIPYGPDVLADALVDTEPGGQRPRAFDRCCDDDGSRAGTGFLLLTGLSLTRGEDRITMAQEDGWSLRDLGLLWDPFIERVLEHDMEMGAGLWRYYEFRQGRTGQGEDALDIFARIRAMGSPSEVGAD